MLVRGLLGPYAGRIVDMRFDDVLRAEANSSVIRLTADEAARYAAGPEDATEEVAPPVPLKKVEEKRRGGWPKGKPRGVHVHPEILA